MRQPWREMPKFRVQVTGSILILQGPPGPFSRVLGRAFEARGAKVTRVNFCIGDWLTWPGRGALNYRGPKSKWADWLAALIVREGVTDILYYGDQKPYHKIAGKVADQLGVRTVSYEFGYLRPDWLIVERGGQSSFSHFPEDLDAIRAAAEGLPEADRTLKYPYPFRNEAFHEVFYNLVTYFLWFFFPRYDADRYYNPMHDYLSYLPRLIGDKRAKTAARAEIDRLVDGGGRFFVLPLQKQEDYQIRSNTPYDGLHPYIREVIASFAQHAPDDTELVVKLHPLDNGIEPFRRTVRRAARDNGVAGRVSFIDGGDLGKLMRTTAGVITLNSTVGVHALQAHAPVKCLGIAVYDIAGLTHQGPLDTFWTDPAQPDPEGVDALVRLMADAIHVKGCFHTREGRLAGAAAIADKVLAGRINAGAFVDPPPRLARARAMGIAVD
jgi:capsular polysaccharide export protein